MKRMKRTGLDGGWWLAVANSYNSVWSYSQYRFGKSVSTGSHYSDRTIERSAMFWFAWDFWTVAVIQQVAAACSTSLTCLTKKGQGPRCQYNVARAIWPSQLSCQDAVHQFQTPKDCYEDRHFFFFKIFTIQLHLVFSVSTSFLNDYTAKAIQTFQYALFQKIELSLYIHNLVS